MRPGCDGSTYNGTRNCDETARWLLQRETDPGPPSYACDRHMAQVSRELLDGEHGQVMADNLHADDN